MLILPCCGVSLTLLALAVYLWPIHRRVTPEMVAAWHAQLFADLTGNQVEQGYHVKLDYQKLAKYAIIYNHLGLDPDIVDGLASLIARAKAHDYDLRIRAQQTWGFHRLPVRLQESFWKARFYCHCGDSDQADPDFDVRPSYVAPEVLENREQVLRDISLHESERVVLTHQGPKPKVAVFAKAYSFENSMLEPGHNLMAADRVVSIGSFMMIEFDNYAHAQDRLDFNHSAIAELVSKCSPLKSDIDNYRVLLSWKVANTMQIDPMIADQTIMHAFVKFKCAYTDCDFRIQDLIASSSKKQ